MTFPRYTVENGHMSIATVVNRNSAHNDELSVNFYNYHNPYEFDWCYAVGAATSAIAVDITEENGKYIVKFKYYIYDVYDWDKSGEPTQYYMHTKGFARSYLSIGKYESDFTSIGFNMFPVVKSSLKTFYTDYSSSYLSKWMLSLGELDTLYWSKSYD